MKVVVLGGLVLGLASVAAGACVDAEKWGGVIGARVVTCCARHGTQGIGNPLYIDDVTLWCSRARVRSLTIEAWHSETFSEPVVSPSDRDRACRVGPRFRRPPPVGPQFIGPIRQQRQCCRNVVATVAGDFGPFGTPSGSIAVVRGDIHCGNRTVPFALVRVAP